MRLESALNSGREGLTAQGQAISVIGDNIANSNTTGFKESRVEFADLVSEGVDGRQSTTATSSGAGVAVRQIRQLFTGGELEDTGRSLDAGIAGEGFFIVGSATDQLYSRAGNFSVDKSGNVVDGNGLSVLGLPEGSTTLSALNLSSLKLTGSVTSNISLTGNLDAQAIVSSLPTSTASFNALNTGAAFSSSTEVFDSLGASHNIAVYYYKTATNTFTAQAYIDGGDVTGGTKGVPVKIGQDATLNFTSAGSIDTANAAAAIISGAAPAYSNGAAAGNFTVNLANFTQFASPSNLATNIQDGKGAGNVSGFEIAKDGSVNAVLDTGSRQKVGTLQLANFTNVDGLDRVGSSLFRAGSDVGTIEQGTAGTGSLGTVSGGTLERSNVDLSDSFVDLIVYQRGYQASSQSLSTANQLLRDTLGLIR